MLKVLLASATAGVFAAVLSAGAAAAHAYDAGALHIDHPWVKVPPPGAPTAAGYLTITNHGAAPEHLLGGDAPGVAPIQIHEMSMTGQIMRMRPIVGGLLIAPGQTVAIAPGGDRHLMLIGPKRALKTGDKIPATLRFEKAGAVRVVFVVQDQPTAMHMGSMANMEMH